MVRSSYGDKCHSSGYDIRILSVRFAQSHHKFEDSISHRRGEMFSAPNTERAELYA